MRSGKKILRLFRWLLLAPGLAIAGTAGNAASPSTNLLSICLATNVSVYGSISLVPPTDLRSITQQNLSFNVDSSTLTRIVPRVDGKLVSPPILSDSDFVAWDVTNHTFVITPEAAKRLVGNYGVFWASPFAIVCFGEPIYFGQFDSSFSSSSCLQPIILVDMILDDCFGGLTNVPDEVWPLVRWQGTACGVTNLTERLLAMTNACTNVTLQIQLGYPSEAQFLGPDPRDDKRIAAAVKKLFEERKKSALKN